MLIPAPPSPSAEWDLFRTLLPIQALNDLDPKAPQAVYTPYTLTWMLLYQRLHGNATLNDAVSEFTQRFPDLAHAQGSPSRPRTLSANSGAYAQARLQLKPRVLHTAAATIYDTLIETYPPSWRNRRAFFVDGTTIPLAPTAPLRTAFPPASNQHGPSHGPILHLAVAHELASGLAVFPAYGPMYGPQAVSELALAQQRLPRLPAGSILLGDRNFGVFAFAWAARQAGHDVLLRLTEERFESLRKKARFIEPGQWELTWRPSRWDRRAHPELPAQAEIHVWLHAVQVSEKRTLWLVETVNGAGSEMAALYRHRLDVETDIKDLKITLQLDAIKSKSVAMVDKELAAGVAAYNLSNQVRRLAATRLQLSPRRLSFAGVWSLLKVFLLRTLEGLTASDAEQAFERLLQGALPQN